MGICSACGRFASESIIDPSMGRAPKKRKSRTTWSTSNSRVIALGPTPNTVHPVSEVRCLVSGFRSVAPHLPLTALFR